MIIGLANTLPTAMSSGLQAQGVLGVGRARRRQPAAGRQPVRRVPRLQPDRRAAGTVGRTHAPGVNADVLTGKTFFPQLITEPFHSGLIVVFIAAAVMMLIGAVASLFNPGKYADAPGADNDA